MTSLLSPADEIAETIRGFHTLSPSSFRIFGQTWRMPQRRLDPDSPSALEAPALGRLEELLYAGLHCRQDLGPSLPERPRNLVGNEGFLVELSRSNHGGGSWQSGWTLLESEGDGRVAVEYAGIRFTAAASDVRPVPNGGSTSQVRISKENHSISPGFYVALGDAPDDVVEPTVRLYWHVRPRGAVRLMGLITTSLNRLGVPFAFKVLSHPDWYDRSDAAVLYLPASAYRVAVDQLAAAYQQVSRFLSPSVTVWGKRLAPGLALAEDPDSPLSFGQHRSRCFARALAQRPLQPQGRGRRSISEVFSAIESAGLVMAQPYLNAGSSDTYPVLGLE